MRKSLLLFTAVVSWAMSANADSLKLGVPSYGGNGCPAGTASISVADDQQSLSVLFDAYSAEAGETTGRRVDRKSCNLAIPVKVPQGYSLTVIGVDYRGFNAIPGNGANTRFDVEYFWAGARGPRMTKQYRGPMTDSFQINHELLASTLVWSACGADVVLRVNSSATAISNNRMDQTMMIVDSADISAGMIYHLQWKRCR